MGNQKLTGKFHKDDVKDYNRLWDIHTHFLPAVDDGPICWEDSMAMLKQTWDSGIVNVVATPHFLPWRENPAPEEIRQLCRQAEERFGKTYGRSIRVFSGAELYYHSGLLGHLESGKAMTLNDTKWILLEFPVDVAFSILHSAVLELENAGYGTILAHMERYTCLQEKENIERVKSSGALLQANISSVYGSVFNKRTRWLRKLFKAEAIDMVASDMHNLSSRPPISQRDFPWYEDNLDQEYWNALRSGIPKI